MGAATSQLSIYQGALRILRERRLTSITENREPRRLLDDAWNNGGVQFCLEQAQWNAFTRSSQFDASTSVQPPFGFRYAFPKPSDWCVTCAVCSDPYFRVGLTEQMLIDEAGFWFSDIQRIYVRYVSNDVSYGNNYGLWSQTFESFVQTYFAQQIGGKLRGWSQAEQEDFDRKKYMPALVLARSKDAMQEGAKFPQLGTWAGSRSGRLTRRDRGNPGSLYG